MKRAPHVTAADVGRRAGTSVAVVSYVMNDGPRPVAAETRDRVLRAARELGYRPNRLAGSLLTRRSGFIGLVVPNTANPYFGGLARAIERAADEAGLLTFVANASLSNARERASIGAFLDARVDGLLIIDVGEPLDSSALKTVTVPLVWVHHRAAGAPGPLIHFDDRATAREATAHLLQHGHRRVHCLTGPIDAGPVADRLQGWRDALLDAGIKPNDSWILRSDYTPFAARETVADALAKDQMSSLVAFTDVHAFGVLRAAADRNRRVPDDLAIATCDGTPETEYSVPTLTTVTKPIEALAARAIAAWQAAQLSPDDASDETVGPITLERRQSCGC